MCPSLHSEIELEYVSALANDTALHIEEVIELIDTFTISEIRERIDDIFDPLTTQLVQCGQACLKRLASLVMTDVQGECNVLAIACRLGLPLLCPQPLPQCLPVCLTCHGLVCFPFTCAV